MKKLLILLSIVFLTGCEEGFILDCKTNENVAGMCIDKTPPVLEGVNDIEIELNEDFDLLEGIIAIDDLEGDITDRIIVTENVDNGKPGLYLVKYEIEDEYLNKTTALRYVSVKFGTVETGSNMVLNGDFDYALIGYSIFNRTEGGQGSFDVINNELVVDVTGYEQGIGYAPRLNYAGMLFEQGSYYEVSFDIKADDNRSILVQVGDLLPAAPWYNDFTSGYQKNFEVTNEYQTHTFVFQMSKATNQNGSILFELGDNQGEILTRLYLDNISVVKMAEDYEPPLTDLVAPGKIEAEDYDSMQGIQTEETGDLSGNLNVGWFDNGDYLEYVIYVTASGNYEISFRIASPLDERTLALIKDNIALFEVLVPNTNGWQDYQTITSNQIYLDEGTYTFKIISNSGGVNINYFEFEKVN